MRSAAAAIWLIIAGLGMTCYAAAPPDLDILSGRLKSGDAAARQAAAAALADWGVHAAPVVPQLIQAPQGKDTELRWRAARALGAIGDPAAVTALHAAVDDLEPAVRAQAIFAIGRLGVGDRPALEAITKGLTDKDVNVRRAAVRALRSIDADRQTIIPLVLKLLEDNEPAVVMPALYTIAEAGAAVVPALSEALEHPEARYWACLVLAEIGPDAKAAVPALTKTLADKRPEVRLQAVIALGEIGPAAQPASSSLSKLLGDDFPSVRAAAV